MPDSPEATLRAFLEHPTRRDTTLKYPELQGFLFAVTSAPELVMPSEWMPIVFGEQEIEYATLDEAREVTGALMTLYNELNAEVAEHRAALPADCVFRSDVLANLDADAPIAQWSRGFLRGHQWLEESWDAYIPDELDEEYALILVTLSFFASTSLAEAYLEESGGGDLAEMATTIREVFPDALADYASLGRTIHEVVRAELSKPRLVATKIGRNEPCPCGSGKKYKKCCGASRV